MGITTIGQLAGTEPGVLEAALGKLGAELWALPTARRARPSQRV